MGLIVPSTDIVKEIIYFSFFFIVYLVLVLFIFLCFSFALGGGASASLPLWGTHPNVSYLLTVNNVPKEAARTKCGSVRLCSSPAVLIMVNTFISPLMKRRMSSLYSFYSCPCGLGQSCDLALWSPDRTFVTCAAEGDWVVSVACWDVFHLVKVARLLCTNISCK